MRTLVSMHIFLDFSAFGILENQKCAHLLNFLITKSYLRARFTVALLMIIASVFLVFIFMLGLRVRLIALTSSTNVYINALALTIDQFLVIIYSLCPRVLPP